MFDNKGPVFASWRSISTCRPVIVRERCQWITSNIFRLVKLCPCGIQVHQPLKYWVITLQIERARIDPSKLMVRR
jgi:hypothetical protein